MSNIITQKRFEQKKKFTIKTDVFVEYLYYKVNIANDIVYNDNTIVADERSVLGFGKDDVDHDSFYFILQKSRKNER